MVSHEKTEDKKFLLELILLIELLIKKGTTETMDLAERFGDHYLNLEEKIKTYPYSMK